MCYTQIKLEHKTNILTTRDTKTNINKGKDMNYETFNNEARYVSPDEMTMEAADLIKKRRGNTILQAIK